MICLSPSGASAGIGGLLSARLCCGLVVKSRCYVNNPILGPGVGLQPKRGGPFWSSLTREDCKQPVDFMKLAD